MRSRRAFTLVELLVVIGIIALLVGILMPALSRAKESANRIACLANLRTLGQGFVMYTNDNRGRYPRPGAGGGQYEDWVYWENTAARPFEQ
jgi:prepilin-type N-terminal cleavage/methylation domain-containing protein